ncbi:beta-lactamase-like protein [Cercophora samala]|uniref:Beta-lactamase-like protein n=1 Tax=Cercophora samala TaxID=330535 RepID=A0AA39ZGN1_9PEZI|nr:beta-lactamase-like protein [Cercophora samala]
MPGAPRRVLSVPASTSTVSVSAINTTATIHSCPADLFFGPPIPGHKWLAAPIWSFLICHPTLNKTLLFDLGIRKDWGNLAPGLISHILELGWKLHVDKDVHDILAGNGVDTSSIDGIILSHHHFDHIGDPSTFPTTVPLIVGPGFTTAVIPGYPSDPSSVIRESDYAGRQTRELDFGEGSCKIGSFDALDYFGDGSLYLLNAPGHTVGHICAFARVTSNSFVLLAGDAIHHVGELRPSPYLQLPEKISPSPFSIPAASSSKTVCPGSLRFSCLLPNGPTASFYMPCTGHGSNWHHDVGELRETVRKLQELDCSDQILVCASHDESLHDIVEFFPAGTLDHFVEQGWKEKVTWRFLRDFGEAVNMECEGPDKFPNDAWA